MNQMRRAGTGRFHGGVQRQDVGLEGNILDGGDDLVDLLGSMGDVLHGGNHLVHLLAGQISAVVQSNSASSEESAAVSAELFNQVRVLADQTNRFHLRGEGTNRSRALPQ